MPTTDWDGDDDFSRAKDNSGFVQDDLADHPAGLGRGYDVGSLTEGLVAYYPLDEGQGQVVHDGGLDNLAQINGATWNGSGQVGDDALSFDGTDDYVQDSDATAVSGSFSASAWVKFDTLSDRQRILTVNSGNIGLEYNNSNDQLQFSHYSSESDSSGTLGTFTPSTEVWYHIVGTFDGDTQRLYIDSNQNDSNSFPNDPKVDYGISIGAYSGASSYLDGVIDHVAVYDRALSQPEVEALANLTSPVGREITESDVPSQSDNGVSRYEFEGDVTDSWGTNDGTDNTSAGFVDGVFGQAKDFDGSDDYVDLPDLGLSTTSDFSISFWSNPTDFSSVMYPIGLYDGSDDIFFVEYQTDGTLQVRLGHTGGTSIQYTTSATFPSDWHKIGLVWDSANTELSLYKSGSLVRKDSASVDDPFDDTENIDLGRRSDGQGFFFGALDDVRIYDKALTDSKVEQLFNKGSYRIARSEVLQ